MSKLKSGDYILIAVFLLIALIAYIIINMNDVGGQVAVVTVDGKEYGRYPLKKDTRITISQKNGKKNVIVVEDGRAYMESASCPDKLCVKQGKKETVGESAVCLPNRVVLSIEGYDSEIDTIAQ